jgi:HSP90 family molecular chaperone
MTAMPDGDLFGDSCLVLLEQALLVEGVALTNPADFVKRLNVLMEKAL